MEDSGEANYLSKERDLSKKVAGKKVTF